MINPAFRAIVDVASDLTLNLASQTRYERLLAAMCTVFPCDAAALLRLEGNKLVPMTVMALRPEAMGQVFELDEHPRLNAILRAREPVRFDAHDPTPDPFDGLIEGVEGAAVVHSCVGCALLLNGKPIGAITLDALDPRRFDDLDLHALEAFAKLAAATVQTAELIDALEATRQQQDLVAQHLVLNALERHGGRLLGMSPAMVRLREEIEVVAPSELTVLVHGETGTGKELVVRTLHAHSRRDKQALVQVNCAALPESIAESELFGHEKGAFTGATSKRPGKFELADGATIFLDEIGELPLSIQAKLLRFLQFGEIQRVGADRVRNVNVRVITATNRNLVEEVKAGRFRADLYHRLSVYPIFIEPLRERREDILLLAGHLLDRSRLHLGIGRIRLSQAARDLLERYDWPGNIRELEHVITRAALRASGGKRQALSLIEPVHIGLLEEAESTLHLSAMSEGVPRSPAAKSDSNPSPEPPLTLQGGLSGTVDAYQRRLIIQAVEACGGNWSEAARRLEIDRSNLYRLAKRLELR